MIYDALIVVAIWMAGAAAVVLPAGGAVEDGPLWFRAWLLLLAWLYFAVCWSRYGRTVGMGAWRIRLVAVSSRFGPGAATIRLAVACLSLIALGAGYWSALFRTDRAGWHDLASGSRLVVDPAAIRRD